MFGMLRLAIWYFTAYTIVILFHEGAHAATAAAFGMPATLFNFWVDVDLSNASPVASSLMGAAGPGISLLVGFVGWLLYRRRKDSAAAGLPLLMLAAHGVSNFFGNLMSAAFVGDSRTRHVGSSYRMG